MGQSRETWPSSPPALSANIQIRRGQGGRRTVVALLTLGAITRHMPESAAGVAGLRTTTKPAVTAEPALRAVARNVADLAALVAFLAAWAAWAASRCAAAGTAVHVAGARLGAFTGDVARGAAAVARFRLGGYSAFPACWEALGDPTCRWEERDVSVYLLTWPWPACVPLAIRERSAWVYTYHRSCSCPEG